MEVFEIGGMGKCSYAQYKWKCPEQTWRSSEEYCIFHDPSPEKDYELFDQKLKENLKERDYLFLGYYFPEDVNFHNWKFEEDAIFAEATFQKDAIFAEATFQKDAIFYKATFQEDADFYKATFQEDAIFAEATFQKAFFYEATFKKDAYFSEATFQEADFFGATFQKAFFREVTFQDTDFWEATFQDAFFFGATFRNAFFREATFQGTVYFWEASFQGTAHFNGATFQGYASFDGVTFQDAHFTGASFQDAYFNGATFQGYAHFSGTTFQGTAFFKDATFQDVYFDGATFQDAHFWEASFQGTASFELTTFQGTASFELTTFQGYAHFWGVAVKESFDFSPKEISGILDLRESKFFFSGSITVNLEKARFHHAHFQNVTFIDCKWPENYTIYEERKMIYVGLSFRELETIYRDLKQNMQNHGDYTTAGNLYYREMEMRRKGTETKKKRLWLELYRILAGYGEKPERTALSSAVTIFAFAFFYGISGCLQYTIQNPCLYQQIKDSIYFSFVTFTTLGLGDIRPLNDLGKFLICCEAVAGAFLIALFVVVFARKMMR